MEITTLASGSTGNCYFVSAGGSRIMIECGLPIEKIKKACNYKLHDIDFCLVSHEHKDHCKAAADIMGAGIDLYCSSGTAEALGLSGHRLNIIQAKKQYDIGPWSIKPFETQHDALEPFGFLIANGCEKLLFATDTYYLRYTFSGLTRIMLECNYALDTLDENIADGYVDEQRRSRLLQSHMSLDQCKKTLLANDLSRVMEIYLLHLSFMNADADRFKREIMRITGKRVIIAGQ